MGAHVDAPETDQDGQGQGNPANPAAHIRRRNRNQRESDRGMTRYVAVSGCRRMTEHEVVEQFSRSVTRNDLFEDLGKDPHERPGGR